HEAARPRLERAQLGPILRDWFDATGEADVASLQSRLRWRTVDQGQALYRAGEPADMAYLVVSGQFEVRQEDEASGGQARSYAGRGAILGETACGGGARRWEGGSAIRGGPVVVVAGEGADGAPAVRRRLAVTVAERVVEAGRPGVGGVVGTAVERASGGDGDGALGAMASPP